MSKTNVVVPEGTQAEGVVSGTINQKEITTMNNNIISTRVLNVREQSVSFRKFDTGYFSVNTSFSATGVADLSTYGQARGFVGALADLNLYPNATIVSGFHCLMGLDKVKNIWDAPERPVAYVNWTLLDDQGVIDRLASDGVVREDEGAHWVALGVKRGSFFRMFVLRPQKWEVFVEWLKTEKGIADPKSDDAKFYVNERFEKSWATQNRHDGFEVAVRLLAGTLHVKIDPKEWRIFQTAKLNDEIDSLFTSIEAQRSRKDAKQDNGDAQRALRGQVYKLAHQEELHTEIPASVNDETVTIYGGNGKVIEVQRNYLLERRFRLVDAAGNIVRPGTVRVNNVAQIAGAILMANKFRALIEVVE